MFEWQGMNLGKLQVCKSMAGYYIGRMCDTGEPGTRESGYFDTEQRAHAYLRGGFELRECMENSSLYADVPELAADTLRYAAGRGFVE